MTAMTPRRLDWTLRVHGTELAAWPVVEREAALSLMRRCGQARQVMADALMADASTDDMLMDGDAPLADAALLASMQCRLGRHLAATAPVRPAIRWGALAACALAGLYLGAAGADIEQPDLFAAVQVIAIDAAP